MEIGSAVPASLRRCWFVGCDATPSALAIEVTGAQASCELALCSAHVDAYLGLYHPDVATAGGLRAALHDVELELLLVSEVAEQHLLVLHDRSGGRRVSLFLGIVEAMSMRELLCFPPGPRALTHAAVVNLAAALGGHLLRVSVDDVIDGALGVALEAKHKGETLALRACAPDAIAIATCAGVRILVARSLLDRAVAEPAVDASGARVQAPRASYAASGCAHPGCARRDVFCFFQGDGRAMRREHRLCEWHARDFMRQFSDMGPAPTGAFEPRSGTAAFEVELVALGRQTRDQFVWMRSRGGARRFGFATGYLGANYIRRQLIGGNPGPPFVHELFHNVIRALGARLDAVVVEDFSAGVFVTKLRIEQAGETLGVDVRLSDGIAIAIASGVPVLVVERVPDLAPRLPVNGVWWEAE